MAVSDPNNFRAVGDRVASLVEELSALSDGALRAKAEELVRSLMQLYGGGIERMLEIVHEEGGTAQGAPVAGRMFERFGDDGLVSTLMLLHGLHPLDTRTRVERALETVRPALAAHGGNVALLAVERDTVRLRLEGNCHGCPSSTVTMKQAVEGAIEEAAPEVVRIEVEGAVVEQGRTAPGECLPTPPAADLVRIGSRGTAHVASAAESHAGS
jgi:Fe-S cluster biogenesis protein NfuA